MSRRKHEEHIPYAEQDDDGMWEPACRDCPVMMEPGMWELTSRYATEAEAVAAANDLFAVMWHPAVKDQSSANELINAAYHAERQARSNLVFEIIWFIPLMVQVFAYYGYDFWNWVTVTLVLVQIVLLSALEFSRRRFLADAQRLRERAVLSRGWK